MQEFILNTPSYEIIMWGAYYLFDFEFSHPENMQLDDFRKYIATIFGGKFFDENISFETEMAFEIRLRSLTAEIMPFYSKKIAVLLSTELKNFANKREISSSTKSTAKNNSSGNAESSGDSKQFNSDFPQDLLRFNDVFNNPQRLSTGSANTSKTSNEIKAANNSESDSDTVTTETYGNIFEFINNFDSLKNVFHDMINEYNILFSLIF